MDENKIKSLPCFRCGKELYEVFEPQFHNGIIQPYKGTKFSSSGHYGSTIFDPMIIGENLIINVCDECLHNNRENARIEMEKHYTPEVGYKKFHGYNTEEQ